MKKTYYQMVCDLIESRYKPARQGMTSMTEIKRICNHFDLCNMSAYDMQNLKDMVSLVYDTYIDGVSFEVAYDLREAANSVTTVIEHFITLKNEIEA